MARAVTIAPHASRALRRARAWLLQDGAGSAGRARWMALLHAPGRLRQFPYLGTNDPLLPRRRCLVVSGYRIIYTVDPDTGDSETAGDVRISAVLGPGQL